MHFANEMLYQIEDIKFSQNLLPFLIPDYLHGFKIVQHTYSIISYSLYFSATFFCS